MPTTPKIDVSIVLNVHAGVTYLPRALRSLEDAAFQGVDAGLCIELLFVLDRSPLPVQSMTNSYTSPAYADIGAVEVSNGSLGLSRNDGLKHARGRYVMFADDDDLISANSVVAFFETAEMAGPRTIVVPQYLIGFGSSYAVAEYLGTDVISPMVFFAHHPYVSRLFLARSAFPELRFTDIPPNRGYAFEDWHFNANAIAKGYSFAHAPKTILFYRQRAAGLLNQHNRTSIRQIPPSALFDPRTFLDRSRRTYRETKGRSPHVDHDKVKRDFLGDVECRLSTWAANRIDPSIKWHEISRASTWINTGCEPGSGAVYYRACEKVVGQTFSDVVLAPSLSDHVRHLVAGLRRLRGNGKILLLLASSAGHGLSLSDDAQLVTIPLHDLRPGVSDYEIDLVTLRLTENVATNARLHFMGSAYARRFVAFYNPVLLGHRLIYYRDPDRVESDGTLSFVSGVDFEFISEWHGLFSAIVVPSRYLLDTDLSRIGAEHEKWHVLSPAIPRASEPGTNSSDIGRPTSMRVLWYSDGTLPHHLAVMRGVEAALQARSVDAKFQTISPEDMREGLIRWMRGEARHELRRASQTFAGLVFAALCDDTPPLLIEASAVGLPCVAPDVGGVSEVVLHDTTGYLLSAPEGTSMIDEIVAAIMNCLHHVPTRTRLSVAAKSHVQTRYSLAAFNASLAVICDQQRSLVGEGAADSMAKTA